MQLYVDRHTSVLDNAIREATGIRGTLEWVSPIRTKNFREFKDSQFLEALKLDDLAGALRDFWPSSGPRWDGLAIVSGQPVPTVVLVEAKNYPAEVRGGGCKASDKNGVRALIEAALSRTASELKSTDSALWMGPLYQYANRLAHAEFLRRSGIAAFMVNACFYGDPKRSRATTEEAWRRAALTLKAEMGLEHSAPSWLADVFLPYEDGQAFLRDVA